jgi:hypothetical protein
LFKDPAIHVRSTLAKHLADIAELSLKFLDLVTLGGIGNSGDPGKHFSYILSLARNNYIPFFD